MGVREWAAGQTWCQPGQLDLSGGSHGPQQEAGRRRRKHLFCYFFLLYSREYVVTWPGIEA